MQSLERTKRVIIALHGWTGNINSLKPIAKLWKFPATKWVYIQGPYKENPEGYSWFGGNNRNGWKYEKSFQKLNDLIQDLLINGYKHKEMYILGFSQGACLAMEFMIRQRFSSIPDMAWEIHGHWAGGDRACSEWTVTGTEPNGDRLEWLGCDLWHLDPEGRVLRKDTYWKYAGSESKTNSGCQ